MKDTSILHHIYGETSVFIFSDHSVALKAWATVRAGLDAPPLLLTLDHHTDTHEPFISYACEVTSLLSGREAEDKVIEECLSNTNVADPQSLESALQILKHDEHIKAAIRLAVIDAAFVLAYDQSQGTPSKEYSEFYSEFFSNFKLPKGTLPPRPHTYDVPEDRIFYLPNHCSPDCKAMLHTESCIRPHADCAIEASFLSDKLEHGDEMIKALGFHSLLDSRYILDLDLDYFMTKRALHPSDPSVFYQLLQCAAAITIACEPEYMKFERLDEDLNAKYALSVINQHLTAALGEQVGQ